jgi:hypothetical protein
MGWLWGLATKEQLTLNHRVPGSSPGAPTTQSIGIELRPIAVRLSRGTWAFRVYVRLCIGLRKTKMRFLPLRLCIEKFRS